MSKIINNNKTKYKQDLIYQWFIYAPAALQSSLRRLFLYNLLSQERGTYVFFSRFNNIFIISFVLYCEIFSMLCLTLRMKAASYC